MRIARVFPRKTSATPTDALAFTDVLSVQGTPDLDEIHVSVAFTYDMPKAELMAEQLRVVGVPVKVGGPALGMPSGEFVPGMYVKPGVTFTSRGCPNHCGFCSVWRREPKHIELTVQDGYIINDDNLLAASESHIRAVFSMLERQKNRPCFNGGLEAKIMKPWHVDLLQKAKAHEIFMAYDEPADYDPLVNAAMMLREAGFTFASHTLRAYVLINYAKGDTFEKAEKRLLDVLRLGIWPMAMLYKDQDGHEDKEWRRFQRQWKDIRKVSSRLKSGEIPMPKEVRA